MKKSVTAIIVCLILTLCLAACGADKNDVPDNTDNVQIPAPWTDYVSAEEASAEAGFRHPRVLETAALILPAFLTTGCLSCSTPMGTAAV